MTHRLVDIWWRDVRLPLIVFVPLATLFASTNLDITLAHAWWFDASQMRWIGAHNVFVEDVIHTGGRWAIRAVVLAAIAAWGLSLSVASLRASRRSLGFVAIAMIVSIGIVGALKVLTNVDCPWDLQPFGGKFPVVHLFANRPDTLRVGRCFPAAHASSGYALVALYFAARERSWTWSRIGLWSGVLCGLIFGLAQQARGAHFLSHDVWSAFLVWMTSATLYAFAFNARLFSVEVGNEAARGSRETIMEAMASRA